MTTGRGVEHRHAKAGNGSTELRGQWLATVINGIDRLVQPEVRNARGSIPLSRGLDSPVNGANRRSSALPPHLCTSGKPRSRRAGRSQVRADAVNASSEVESLREALSDLISWFPARPVHEWRIDIEATDAIEAARAALAQQANKEQPPNG